MFDIGRVCIKTAGKDAGKPVIIIDTIDKNFVMIDGQVKRKRCNILHLEPTQTMLSIKKSASHADVVKEFRKLNIEIRETKPKTKKGTKPVSQHTHKKQHEVPEKKDEKKPDVKKKEEKKKPSKKEKAS